MQRQQQIEELKTLMDLVARNTTALADSVMAIDVSEYYDPEQFEREKIELFRNYPQFVGPSCMIPAPGDYFALLAYLDRGDEQVATLLQAIRHRVRDRCRVATCLGYGPRYLHATGQVYKGGPATGVFLMLTRDVIDDIASPGRQLRFGITQTAQALADQNELIDRGRRIVRVHLGRDPVTGLEELTSLVLRTKAG